MTITIWINPVDLERFANLVNRLNTVVVLESEIQDLYLEWQDQPHSNWLQTQIDYSTYIRLNDARTS